MARIQTCGRKLQIQCPNQYTTEPPGSFVCEASCFRGTWYKPYDIMHMCPFVAPAAVLDRSVRNYIFCVAASWTMTQICCINIFTVTLSQHCTTLGHYFSMLPLTPANTDILLLWYCRLPVSSKCIHYSGCCFVVVNCWPNEVGSKCDVNIEYSLENVDMELNDVVITIPLPWANF